MSFKDWFQSLPLFAQTLLAVVMGLVIASPYWGFWLYLRRQRTINRQDELVSDDDPRLQDPAVREQAGRWHQSRMVLMVIFGSFAFIALRGFRWSQGTFWFHLLNIYYVWMVLLFVHKAFSRREYELESKLSPHLDRRTWLLRWIPMFVVLPIMGWLANSLPIVLGN